jgi:hypothetical protein
MIIYIDRRQYLVSESTQHIAEELAKLRRELRLIRGKFRAAYTRTELLEESFGLIFRMRVVRQHFFEARLREARASHVREPHPLFASIFRSWAREVRA